MLPTPPPPVTPTPGWYPDPWAQAAWRWWDGRTWTAHVAHREQHKPRLPAWLSLPVIPCFVLVVLAVGVLGVQAPLAIALGLVPLVIVAPVLQWLDRVEPEPRAARLHALLWGATVAVVISSLVNGVVAGAAGETVAAVVSAPFIEEATKAGGIWYAVRRRELDGVMDGVIYAGWTALGFAVVEDFLYFTDASADGQLAELFVIRALLTPFAHPLFTAWTGLAIGSAVAQGKPLFPRVLVGYGLAVASHMAWNGSLSAGEDSGALLPIAILLFVGLFVVGTVSLIVVRRREQARFVSLVPWLAQRYGLTPAEVAVFGDWKGMLSVRRGLPKSQRKHFDQLHAALARLAHLHQQPGPTDHTAEEVLAAQLHRARTP